ncbi:MAG TPA: tetratricopeptide repeat protein, partial [Pyrinomonadaceae bacterium]|nr:tetratricopeptide repeat protein [Pyrinomonadaceae bacterium]
MSNKYLHYIFNFCLTALLLVAPLVSTSCAALWRSNPETQTSEAQALENLRRMAEKGTLPPESVVANLETSYPNTKTAALARLLRAQIRLQNNDPAGAASLLENQNLIRQKTSLGDYALWLRGQALAKTGRNTEAQNAYEQLIRDFPASLRAREAKLGLAELRRQTGETERVVSALQDLTAKNDGAAWLLIAKTYEQKGDSAQAAAAYRKVYFFAPASAEAGEAQIALTRLNSSTNTANAEEILGRAEGFYAAKKYSDAANAYQMAATSFPAAFAPEIQLRRGIALANAKKTMEAAAVFNSIPTSAGETKANALYELARAYAAARMFQQARQTTEDLRRQFPNSNFAPKALVAAGMQARDAKNKLEESAFLRSALTLYPNAVEVGQAQFELAWLEHEN